MALGLALNIFLPLRSMDQWFRIFLWGTTLRAAAFGFLLWSGRRCGSPIQFGPANMPVHAALIVALWCVFLSAAHGEPWGWGQRLLAVPACVMVGLFEETLFRGVLLDGLSERWGPARGGLASSVLFALFHTRPQALAAWPHIFLTGCVFANLRSRGMGLGALAGLHALVDLLFFFRGKESVTEYGPSYWVFLGGLFVYAALSAPRPGRGAAAGAPSSGPSPR
jgi:membrane protease YdiL (CAAX protease family)